MKTFTLLLLTCSLVLVAARGEPATRAARAEELYRLVMQMGKVKSMPYQEIAALPKSAEDAKLPPAAIEEIRMIARELESEMRRLEKLMIEALAANFNEEDLNGLIAFAKSELGRKLGKAAMEKSSIKLTREEQKQLQGFARISFAWKFTSVTRRLAKVKKESEKSMSAIMAKVYEFEQKYTKKPNFEGSAAPERAAGPRLNKPRLR